MMELQRMVMVIGAIVCALPIGLLIAMLGKVTEETIARRNKNNKNNRAR